ncbi:MAG: 2-oxoglutarate ferredoxin oxidoreductase subunit alpha [Candidatus Latescibacteria bacterium]|jgi:2-oxoglutarate ferredoxin oxidoreductase subunit alpha|nr:2-oxoglutarate ferredoxin oxidoreductase subunit alpha [Candidatus Latescibacterota bacterium]
MKRYLETGNFAITEGAILAGCRFFAGYPITPATELAESMSHRLPQVGGIYIQGEDECGALHLCIGAALGGYKAMTATSGPGYILYADPYGWAIGCEIPLVILNSGRVGPVSGITGAPGQGEFYMTRYPTQGGNFETIVLAPNSAQEAMAITVESFYLSERFRTPVTILADQLITDSYEDISVPENDAEIEEMGFRTWPRKVHPGPDFYPPTDEIDVPPVVLGRNTGALCSDWTPTEEGYDTEEVEAHHKHAYRLIYKVRNHKELFSQLYEKQSMDDDPDLVVVSYGTPSRVVNTAVKQARRRGLKVGALRLINLWPFPDEHFNKATKYLSVELNWDGQLVREVQRAAPRDAEVHFLGSCGDLPAVQDLIDSFERLLKGEPLARRGWEVEAW